MSILNKLLGKKPEETRTITLTSAVRVKLADGEMIDGVENQSVEVLKSDADYLVSMGVANRKLTEEEHAEIARIHGLIPPPHDPRPLPDSWAELPECFAKAWEISERLRCLKTRHLECETVYLRGSGLTEDEKHWLREETGRQSTEAAQRARLIDEWIQARQLRISVPSDAKIQDRQRVRNAMERIGQSIDDFRREYSERMIELQFACSDEALGQAERINVATRSLADIGFQIFKTRIAALGLGHQKTRELFASSADALKYVQVGQSPPDLRMAYNDPDTGEIKTYIDASYQVLAEFWRAWRDRAEKMEALLKQAKAELAKAEKVALAS